jgi:hypothetical protein
MKLRALGLMTLLIPAFACLRADDDPFDQFIAKTSDKTPTQTQTSVDGRIKVTLLYVGPITDPQIHHPFVITYMIEDCRSDQELQRHPWKTGTAIDSDYYLAPSAPEAYDTHHKRLIFNVDERARTYKVALMPMFKAIYPKVTLPPTDHPDATGVYEYFLKDIPEGPIDITLHDGIRAYRNNSFRFENVGFVAPSTP